MRSKPGRIFAKFAPLRASAGAARKFSMLDAWAKAVVASRWLASMLSSEIPVIRMERWAAFIAVCASLIALRASTLGKRFSDTSVMACDVCRSAQKPARPTTRTKSVIDAKPRVSLVRVRRLTNQFIEGFPNQRRRGAILALGLANICDAGGRARAQTPRLAAAKSLPHRNATGAGQRFEPAAYLFRPHRNSNKALS